MNELMRRRIILGTALIFTLWAVWQVSHQENAGYLSKEIGATSKRTAQTRQPSSTLAFSGSLNIPERQELSLPVRDIFELPKPPVPTIAAISKAAPLAPPLQYVYLGRIEKIGKTQIFLGDGNNVLVAKVGTTLPNGWMIESMEAGRLNFSYEPLGQKQTLQIGNY